MKQVDKIICALGSDQGMIYSLLPLTQEQQMELSGNKAEPVWDSKLL